MIVLARAVTELVNNEPPFLFPGEETDFDSEGLVEPTVEGIELALKALLWQVSGLSLNVRIENE